MNKKGAIELSMSTVVVVVIAIVLLSLGIVFVRNIMGKISGFSEDAFIKADEAIQNLMGEEEEFYISAPPEGRIGETINANGGVQNFLGRDMKFNFMVEAADGVSDVKWVLIPKEVVVKAGDKKGFPVRISIPKNVRPGITVMYNIMVYDMDGKLYGSEIIAINVI